MEDVYQIIGFRNYQLAGGDEHHVRFFALGCQGSASKNQQAVADLMTRIAKDPEHKPDFILILGDNFYDDGVDSPTSPAFKTHFYDIYDKLIQLGIPFFVCLGNHDANRHAKTFAKKFVKEGAYLTPPPFGRIVEEKQILHSYIDPKNIALYSQTILDLSKLPAWNMPFEAYGLQKGDTQIFCLNSNNYLRDYLLDTPTANNQAKWLKEEFIKTKAQNMKIIFAMHHSFETEGKRAFPNKFDATHYLNPEKLARLKLKLNTNTESYNELLALAFEQQGIWPDEVLAAHDHFINYRNTHLDPNSPRKLAQLTLGGGGGDHHHRRSFRGHPFSSHFESYGFAEITINKTNPNVIENRIYTTDGLTSTFTDQNHLPIRQHNDDDQVEKLRSEILQECNRYLSSLKNLEEQNKPTLTSSSQTISTSYFGMFYNMAANAVSMVTETVSKLYQFSIDYMYSNPMTQTVSAVHNMIAYFNRDTTLPDIDTIRSNLKNTLQKLIELKDPETDRILKPLIAILNPDNIPRSQSAPSLSSFDY